MAGTPFTLAEYAALTISDCLTKGYYVVPNAYDLPQLLWYNPTDCYINALRQWNLPFGGTVFLAHHPFTLRERSGLISARAGSLAPLGQTKRASKSLTFSRPILLITSLSRSFACVAKRS